MINSKVYNAIIVDDENAARESLKKELELNCPEVNIIDMATSVVEAHQKIIKYNPDIVFLDIDLGSNSSFQLLDLFNEITFEIIFVTAHNEFAIKAIKYAALDYLLKPVDGVELFSAVNRAKKSIVNRQASFDYLKNHIDKESIVDKIIVNTGKAVEVLTINNIFYSI